MVLEDIYARQSPERRIGLVHDAMVRTELGGELVAPIFRQVARIVSPDRVARVGVEVKV